MKKRDYQKIHINKDNIQINNKLLKKDWQKPYLSDLSIRNTLGGLTHVETEDLSGDAS